MSAPRPGEGFPAGSPLGAAWEGTPFDPERLRAWLAERPHAGETLPLVAVAIGTESAAHTEIAAAELVLAGLILQVTEPRVDRVRLDAFVDAAARLGLDEASLRGLVEDLLGITERRLRAYAVLGLSLTARASEVKTAHRALAKRLHPDRLVHADDEARLLASRQLAEVNAARGLLLGDEGVVVEGTDDLTLDEPWFEPEDAPTVLWGEDEADHVDPDAETVVREDDRTADLL